MRQFLVSKIAFRTLSVCAVFLGLVSTINAQHAKVPPPAPVPAQVAGAQGVFISNAGGATFESVVDQTVFDGGPDRPYNEFYEEMKNWGRYQLLPSPASADLVLEISWVLSDTGLRLPVLGQLRLKIIDPKTHITLWNLTEYVRGAILLSNRDKNFDQAMDTIVNRLKGLVNSPAAESTRK